MEDSVSTTPRAWGTSPTAKEKTAVQRAVTALLDALAPERVLKRGDQVRGSIEQHRTPNGCLLQAENAAVSVSWFVDTRSQASLGELHVNVWRGVVSRGGASYRKAETASIVKELVLVPITAAVDGSLWQSTDGARFDTAGLAAHCLSLLEDQMKAAKA